jgi:hypothetical protein
MHNHPSGATCKRSGQAGTFEKPELTTQRDGLIEHLDDLEAEVESLLPLLIKKMFICKILGNV